MKKIFMMAVMAVAALTANAQQEVGTFSLQPKVGLNVTSITSEGSALKAKAGFTGGVEGMYQATEKFGVSAAVMYSMQGAKVKQDFVKDMATAYGYGAAVGAINEDMKINYGYINIPILANYYVVKGLAVKAGIQPGFMVSAKGKLGDTSVNIKESCKKFDFAIPVGVSYEIANVVIDARYNIGLTKTMKGDGVKKTKNSVFQFTVGYKFAL